VRSKQPAGLKIDEAIIAKNQSKLLPVLIDDLPANEFPMGLHAVRAAQLALWQGDPKPSQLVVYWLRCLPNSRELWAKVGDGMRG